MEIEVKNLAGEAVGSLTLGDQLFGAPVRGDIIQRMVVYQLAKRRQGTRSVKTRADVVGSGAKSHSQKKTGRARQGNKKAGHFRGGGKPFGPKQRDHSIKLPKKVRAMALRATLSNKAQEKKLIVLDKAEADGKTAVVRRQLAGLGVEGALVIDGDSVNQGFARAIANIAQVDLLPIQGINVYDIMRRDTLILTRAAVSRLEERYG